MSKRRTPKAARLAMGPAEIARAEVLVVGASSCDGTGTKMTHERPYTLKESMHATPLSCWRLRRPWIGTMNDATKLYQRSTGLGQLLRKE